jgi:hypothetical protein
MKKIITSRTEITETIKDGKTIRTITTTQEESGDKIESIDIPYLGTFDNLIWKDFDRWFDRVFRKGS